jgi:hypothetical protein
LATHDVSRPPVALRRTAVGWRPAWPGLPVLLLLLGVLLALLAAYSVRPVVSIDIGADADFPYLRGFHAREFSAASPARPFEWPAGSDELRIAEPLSPAFRMVTLTLDEFTPSTQFPRRLIAVYANERRFATLDDRGGAREFREKLPEGLDLSGGLALRVAPLQDRNSILVPPVQARAATLEGARTYRWTTGDGSITFPALGRGAWRVELTAVVAHPGGAPVNAELLANGVPLATLPEYGDFKRLSLIVPAAVVGDGDLTLTIRSNVITDPRPLGVLVERVSLTPLDLVAPLGTALPPWSMLLPALAVALSLYASLRLVRVPAWWALGAAVALLLLGAWALVRYRYPMGFFAEPLALLMLFTAALTPALQWLGDRLFRRLGIPLVPWLRDALVLLFLVGFWLKAGGLLFPYMRAIDVSWHMDRVRWILDGNLAAMWQPGAFSESVMPIDEWGPNRPVIPYSPFFHLFATLFAIFPWSLETSTNLFSALLDSSRVFLLAILALKSGLSNRVALLAAALCAVTPVTFLLHSWGNVPTTSGMWWTLVTTTAIVALYPRLERPGPLAVLTLLSLVTMLFYTVMAVFHVTFVIVFLLLVRVMPAWIERRPAWLVGGATLAAILLSIVIYYGQYIPSMVERTVPYVLSLATRGPESVGVERAPFSEYMAGFWRPLGYTLRPDGFLFYGLLIPLLFCLPGFLALRPQKGGAPERALLWIILAAWFTVGVLFMLAGYRVSMVDKQLFYIVPALCLCWAVYADRYWRRGRAAQLMILLIYAFTLATALDLWVIRIIRSPVV